MRRGWYALPLFAAAFAAAGTALGADYAICVDRELCVDDPAGAIHALASGDVRAFFALQPPMGPVSLLLRLPFAGPVYRLGGSELWGYRAGALACLLVVALLGVVFDRTDRDLRARMLTLLVPVLVAVASGALAWGHPEEPLAAALCIFALVRALRADRRAGLWAGVLLALALGTKEWTVIAGPVIWAAVPRDQRRSFSLSTVCVAAAVIVPMLAGNPGRFFDAQRFAVDHPVVTPFGAWWLLAPGGAHPTVSALGPLPRMMLLAVGFGAAALALRGARRVDWPALLTLVFILRAVLDPGAVVYYYGPALLALFVFETTHRRRPWFTCVGALMLALVDQYERHGRSAADTEVNAALIACVIVSCVALAAKTRRAEPTAAYSQRRARDMSMPLRNSG